jgi:hypothetical protein
MTFPRFADKEPQRRFLIVCAARRKIDNSTQKCAIETRNNNRERQLADSESVARTTLFERQTENHSM